MKGDFTRHTFDPRKHYTSVRMQQGRVQLDADWNEQADLALYRVETESADTIGRCGAPLDAPAFGLVLDLNDLDPAEKAFLAALDPTYDTIVAGDFVLTPGRFYVDGILCESEHAVPYTRQPDLPGLDPIDVSQKGFTIVYLDVWQRHLTYLDDALLRETALGGPDTATRARTVWQVRSVFTGTNDVTCADEPPAYLDAIADGSGLLSARAQREEQTPDPCLVPASAGFRGLENQLYRVEIHTPGEAYDLTAGAGAVSVTIAAPEQIIYTGASGSWAVGDAVEIFRSAAGSNPMDGFLATIVEHDTGTKTLTLNTSLPDLGAGDAPQLRPVEATFKWSRDNGSVVTLVTFVDDRELTVASVGPDEALGFSPGQWVELIDEVTELDGRSGFLAEIEDVDPAARVVTLRVAPPAFDGEIVKLRRWDGIGAVKTNPPGTAEPFTELENGVQLSFSDGTYDTGDYWLIPARTATADERSGTIEWPTENDEPLAQPPLGIRHHYCKLAVLESDGAKLTVEDCRPLFPPLTELSTIVYVGGDGQEAMPGKPLPQLLEAGVFRGRHPVEGARVRFTADVGGRLAATLAAVSGGAPIFEQTTGADGIAACAWLPANDLARPSQRVEARMLDSGGTALDPQIDYNAQLSIASNVAYTPGACADLSQAGTVQEALDILCRRPTGGSCCVVVGPEEASLDEVIERLLSEDERHICLTLKPGKYQIDGLDLDRERLLTLVIEGCGAAVSVDVGRFTLHGLDAVEIRDLDIVLMGETPITFDECIEVLLEHTRITRSQAPGPVCQIGRARRVRISNCVLDGHVGVSDRHLAELSDLIAIRDVAEFVRGADELTRPLVEDADARKQLATTIRRARRTADLTPAEREAYNLLALVLDQSPSREAILSALVTLRDAAAFAFVAPTLILMDQLADVLVDACDIRGTLGLYGFPAEPPAPEVLDQEELLGRVHSALREGAVVFAAGGSLHVRDVRVARIAVASEILETLRGVSTDFRTVLPAFRMLQLSDCEIVRTGSIVLAQDVMLGDVDFREPWVREVEVRPYLGLVFADTAIVTSLKANTEDVQLLYTLLLITNAWTQAANLQISVVGL